MQGDGRETLMLMANAAFSRAGVAAPRTVFLASNGVNVFVVPTPKRPVLVIAGPLLTRLTHEQIEAVFLHEAAHLACKHFSRRVVANITALLWTAGTLAITFLMALLLLPPQGVILIAMIAPIPAAIGQIALFSKALRAQEYEADRYAVDRLGANHLDLSAALGILSGDEQPSLFAWLRTHPTAQQRRDALMRAYGDGSSREPMRQAS